MSVILSLKQTEDWSEKKVTIKIGKKIKVIITKGTSNNATKERNMDFQS